MTDNYEDDYEPEYDDDDTKSCGCRDDEYCSLCCPHTFGSGIEECDFCPNYDECMESVSQSLIDGGIEP